MDKKGVSATCPFCGSVYLMGVNGIGDGCDVCLGVVRDNHGYVWTKEDKEQQYASVQTGELSTIRRKHAFKKKLS